MQPRHRRSRVVWFRVSPAEYNVFATFCEITGARSMSELARNAVLQLISPGNSQSQPGSTLLDEIRALRNQVRQIDDALDRLRRLLTSQNT